MSKIISLVNNRSASGKTFVSMNLGISLAKLGKKVLLMDLDPQSNLTSHFSVKEYIYTSYRAMVEVGKFAVNQLGDKLYIIPSAIDLVGCELELYNVEKREFVLNKFLEQFKTHFDYIIIDTSPGLGLLVANALTASDIVLIPVNPEEKMFAPNKKLMEAIDNINTLLKLKPLEVYFLLNQCGSNIPFEQLKISISAFCTTKFLKTNIYANYPLNEILNDLKKSELNPYEHFKPSLDFKKLALEIINLKNQ